MKQINKYSLFPAGRLLLAAAALLVGCTNEISPDREQVPYLLISAADIQTRATETGHASENWADRLEILYFRAGADGTSQCIVKDVITGPLIPDAFPYKKLVDPIIVSSDNEPVDIYVVASHDTGISVGDPLTALTALTTNTMASAGALLYPTVHDAASALPIVMSGSVVDHDFSLKEKAEVRLKRQVAKLRVRLENALPEMGEYDETRLGLQIRNASEGARLFYDTPDEHTTAGFISYPWVGTAHPQEVDPTVAGALVPETSNAVPAVDWPHHTYIYPNRKDAYGRDKATTVHMSLPYKLMSETLFTTYDYDIYLGKIDPNHIYQLTIKVYGVGANGETDTEAPPTPDPGPGDDPGTNPDNPGTLNVGINLEVLGWDEKPVDGSIPGSYLDLDATAVVMDSDGGQTIGYATDAEEITVDPAGLADTIVVDRSTPRQLTFSWIGGTAPDTPVDGTITIKAGNIVRTLKVTYTPPTP